MGQSVYRHTKEVDIEVEFRVAKNLEKELREMIGEFEAPTLYHQDHYTSYHPQTGQLHRFREVQVGEEGRYFEMAKFPPYGGHLIEPEPIILSRDEFLERLANNSIIGTVKGSRREVKWNSMSFCLDNIEGLGEYTEIEKIVTNPQDIKKADKEVKDVALRLGVSPDELTDLPYPHLLRIGGPYEETSNS